MSVLFVPKIISVFVLFLDMGIHRSSHKSSDIVASLLHSFDKFFSHLSEVLYTTNNVANLLSVK